MNERTKRNIIIFSIVLVAVLGLTSLIALAIEPDEGVTFKLVISGTGEEIVFSGYAMDQDVKLVSNVSGIETDNLFTGGDLYVINPAIKTASTVETPSVPSRDSSDWIDYLSEPARINPANFHSLIGAVSSVNGIVTFGASPQITAKFNAGVLTELRIPSRSSEAVYSYSDVSASNSVKASDFAVPSGYLVTE
jgi:hypothetical protein